MTLASDLAQSLSLLEKKEASSDLPGKFMRAREMAAAGYGFEDIRVRLGISEREARIIVFGKGSQR